MKNPHFAGDLRKRVHISLLLDVALAFHFALIERVTHRTTIVSLSLNLQLSLLLVKHHSHCEFCRIQSWQDLYYRFMP